MARKQSTRLVDTHFEDTSRYNQASNDSRVAPPSNRLKLRIEDLKTFKPLTENQAAFYNSYAVGEYFMMLSSIRPSFAITRMKSLESSAPFSTSPSGKKPNGNWKKPVKPR